jgi:hypothetical protein
MEENKTLITDGEVNENVVEAVNTDEPTQTAKIYTQEDFNNKLNEIMPRKVARKEARIRKEYEQKYGDLINVLKVGTGKESVEEITDGLKQFYESKNINIQQATPTYSDKDIETLAKAEAAEVIGLGLDDVVEEVERLTELGFDNMSARDKAYFKVLAEHRQKTERHNELSKIGVTDDVLNSKEFNDFAAQFNSKTPIADIYNIYKNQQPKKEFKTAGSMKNNTAESGGVKDYYSYEEAMKFTKEDFDKNPDLFKAVEASMHKWK